MRFLPLVLLLVACGTSSSEIPDAAPQTETFYKCEEGVECETGYCADLTLDLENGAEVCTVACETQQDCQDIHVNSICLCDYTEDRICWSGNDPEHPATPGHCVKMCWPEEDRELCDKYDIFCPSDCEAQGLECGLITIFPFNYGCRPHDIDPEN